MPITAPQQVHHRIRSRAASAVLGFFAGWWGVLHFGAIALVFALSPSTHDRGNRAATARLMYTTTWQVLPWFTVLCALLSLVLIRIVVVTAQSYGLSQFALEMVVRVLVLELIPLSAALFIVLRSGMVSTSPAAAVDAQLALAPFRYIGIDVWRLELVPRVISLAFSVITVAAVSCVVALVLAYTVVYGVSPWGFVAYTRMVGRVFDPAVSLGFVLKIALFSLAVAVVPLATALQERQQQHRPRSETAGFSVPNGTVRLFAVLVLIEGASLAVKYI